MHEGDTMKDGVINVKAGVVTFACILTEDVLKAADVVAKRILSGDGAPGKLAAAIHTALEKAGAAETIKSIDTAKKAVALLLSLSDCPRSIAKNTSERNRWDYYYRTSVQVLCERLKLAKPEENVFALAEYLNRVLKTLENRKVDPAIIADIRHAISIAPKVEDAAEDAEDGKDAEDGEAPAEAGQPPVEG